jgi:hypothetical protein
MMTRAARAPTGSQVTRFTPEDVREEEEADVTDHAPAEMSSDDSNPGGWTGANTDWLTSIEVYAEWREMA